MAARSDSSRSARAAAATIRTAPRSTVEAALEAALEAAEVAASRHADRLIQQSIARGGAAGRSDRVPVDTGDYKRAWRVVRLPDRIEVVSFASPRVKAGVIELGRRPAWIPIAPLAEWVRRKFNVQDPDEARGIAFVISRAASRRRREGLGILAWVRPRLAAEVSRELERTLRTTKGRKARSREGKKRE